MTEEFRKTPPRPLEPKPFNIPAPFEASLSNGLRVVIVENRRLPIVNFRLAFRFGEVNSPSGLRGLASAVSSLLTQGTEKRTSLQLAEESENIGASLHASSSSDNTVLSGSSLTIYRREILDLMAEVLLQPSFPENELSLYKENTIKSLEFQRSQSDFLADEQISRIIYGDHPYGIASPKPSEIEKLTREDLIAFHRENFIPADAMLFAVGDVDHLSLLSELEEVFSGWTGGETKVVDFPAMPDRTERTLTIVDRIGSAQANIVLANPGVKRNHPDYFKIIVMNQILGAGASSRLFMNIREDKGYTYGAYSSFDARRLCGAFEASAEVRTEVTKESLNEFFYELNRIRDGEVSESELQDAKDYLAGVFPLRAETQEGLTNLIVSQKLNDLPADYLQTYRDNVNNVTRDDVKAVAEKFVTPERMAIVIVGDAREILAQAEEFSSSIEIYSSEGELQEISNYRTEPGDNPATIDGKWSVTIDFQGQKIPVSFNIEQSEAEFSGAFESAFGAGVLTNGVVTGSRAKADVSIDFQGMPLLAQMNASINGEVLSGVLASSTEGFPELSFTGARD